MHCLEIITVKDTDNKSFCRRRPSQRHQCRLQLIDFE